MVRKVFAGIVVNDLAASRVWYERALDHLVDAEPMDGLLEWHFLESSRLQVVDIRKVREVQHIEHWGRAGASSVALVVDDLDAHLAKLRAANISIGVTYSTPGFVKTATVADPDGNLITFVEELPAEAR